MKDVAKKTANGYQEVNREMRVEEKETIDPWECREPEKA